MTKPMRMMSEQLAAKDSRSARADVERSDLTIIMNPMDLGFAEYVGTRAQLEAERVIPAGITWPQGFHELWWRVGPIQFRLHRQRPEGAKGPRRMFLDVDNWCLRFEPKDRTAFAMLIERKAKEMREILYLHSPQGQLESSAKWMRTCAARDDEKFQAFKALIPGLTSPKQKPRGRRRAADAHLPLASCTTPFSTSGQIQQWPRSTN